MRNVLRTKEDRLRERKLISPVQRRIGVVLIALGALIALVGLFGYLVGDWQISPFAEMADQVFIAREVALSTGTGITGAFDMDGEESGVHVYYASLSVSEDDHISAEDFEIGESKKALKGGSLQFPATKDRQTSVIAEDQPITLDNGLTMTRCVKFPGAGSSKYRSLKTTVEGPCTLTVYAMSSLSTGERRLVLCNSLNGQEVASAMAPAFSAEGVLTPVTMAIPAAGT